MKLAGSVPRNRSGWTENDLATFFEMGMTPKGDFSGDEMGPVLQATAKLKEEERRAIAKYLKSLEPLPSSVGKIGNSGVQGSQTRNPKNLPVVNGIVRRINPSNLTITIKHERIPNLQMAPMAMPFVVTDLAMLDGLKEGDVVIFSADEIQGTLTLIWIERKK